jgi:hypothetical protein
VIAQTYPCETTIIGKLVTKPLLKNGKINYDLAVKDTSDPKAKSGKDITTVVDKSKEDGNVYIARHVTKDETTYDLLFVTGKTGQCTYQVTRIGNQGVYGIRLNEDGDVIDWDQQTVNTKDMQKEQEKLANEWLKYFGLYKNEGSVK